MTTLYYVIELNTQPGEGHYDDLTGTKEVTVYTIRDSELSMMFSISLDNNIDSEGAIINWLYENKYNVEDFKYVRL